MFTCSSLNDDDAAAVGHSLNVCALVGYAALVLADAELPRPSVHGTIGASIEAASGGSLYRGGSETLIRGTPVAPMPNRLPAEGRQLHARDLIAELHTINAQIDRIMSQVERAMSRLGSGG